MRKFLGFLREKYPDRKPLFYTNPKFIKEVLYNDVPDDITDLADLWIAHWEAKEPLVKGWKTFKFWQFKGDVPNLPYSKNGFDLDYYNGDKLDIYGVEKPALSLEQRVEKIEKFLNLNKED